VSQDQDRSWALRTLKGEQEAFAELVAAYQSPVYNLAFRMLGTATEAEDAAQETFLRAFDRLDTYDPGRKFSSWILAIASHYCVDRLRRRRGNTVSMEEIKSWRWLPDKRPRPEDLTLGNERDAKVRRLLLYLPPQYRLVITLRYWNELSYVEIAQVTKSTESAVKSRLHRARRMMAEKLMEDQAAECLKGRAERRKGSALSGSY
jgi:RNA polymerase sigma-70 factor (ECF subfamily)